MRCMMGVSLGDGRGLENGSSGRLMDSTVLSTYKSELREFRALQEELEPWTEAFKAKHARKPCLVDVESTRAPQPTTHCPPFVDSVTFAMLLYLMSLLRLEFTSCFFLSSISRVRR